MDLTSGITQMQSQLKPDAFAGYVQGANAYATAEKQGQEIAANRIKNEQAKREQDIQTRLQKAIEESYDEKTGQPDYNKLAATGHKYGISAQQMDYAIKHLKDNWSAISEVAKSKLEAKARNPEGVTAIENAQSGGWSAQPTKKAPAEVQSTSQGVAPVTSQPQEATQPAPQQAPLKEVPELTEAQKALSNADGSRVEQANGLIGGLNAAVAQSGNPAGTPIPTRPQVTSPAMDAQGNVVGTAGDSWNRAQTAPTASTAPATQPGQTMDLGSGLITAQAPQQDTMYAIADKMKAPAIPTAMQGAARSEYPVESVKAWSADQLNEAIRGLRNAGVNLPADNLITPEIVAKGISEVQNNAVDSLYKGFNPFDPEKSITNAFEAQALAPKARQKAVEDLLVSGRETKSTRLGQASTTQATAQSKTAFDQQQAEIADAKARGYSKVNAGNVSEFRDADAKYTQLGNTRKEIEDLNAESPKLTDDQFNAKFEAMLIGPKSAEGIGTEAGTSRFMEALRKDKSYGQMFHEAEGLKDVVKILAKNNLSSQGRQTILKIMDGVVEAQMKTGVAKSKLDTFKPWNKKKVTEGKEGAGAIVRKPGEKLSDFIRRGGKI